MVGAVAQVGLLIRAEGDLRVVGGRVVARPQVRRVRLAVDLTNHRHEVRVTVDVVKFGDADRVGVRTQIIIGVHSTSKVVADVGTYQVQVCAAGHVLAVTHRGRLALLRSVQGLEFTRTQQWRGG